MNKKEMIVYETDASRLIGKVEKIVFPKTIEEVQNIVKTSSLDIVPRGAGTGLVGGCIPNNSLILDLNKLKNVFNLDKARRTIYVEAGVTLKELNDKLDAVGFEFPIQPMNNGISTIGGMISTNAAGVRDLGYDCMRNWVEEIEFVNGRGELSKTTKTDLMDICGMEGITGVIVGAKLKILPKINRTASIFQSETLEEVLSISRRLKSEKDICMLLFFSKEVSRILKLPEKYHILIEFDSERGKIKDKDYDYLMNLKDNVYSHLANENYFNSEDPKFFQDKLKEFILFLESSQIPYFAHLGSGVIHPFFKDEEESKRAGCFELMKRMRCKLGEYGFGITRKDFLEDFDIKILQRVKLRHDPFGKLNQGKIIRFNGEKSIQKSREIKSSESEKMGVEKITESLKKPVEKMDKLIKEAEVLDKVEEKIQEPPKEEIISIKKIDEKLIQEGKTVGEVLKGIPPKVEGQSKNNVNKMANFVQRVEYEEQVYEEENLKEKRLSDPKANKEYVDLSENKTKQPENAEEVDITKIMTNQLGNKLIEELPESSVKTTKFNFKEAIKRPEIDGSQEVDGKAVPRGKISDSEKDLINSVLGNRFGFGNGDKKENDEKKESEE